MCQCGCLFVTVHKTRLSLLCKCSIRIIFWLPQKTGAPADKMVPALLEALLPGAVRCFYWCLYCCFDSGSLAGNRCFIRPESRIDAKKFCGSRSIRRQLFYHRTKHVSITFSRSVVSCSLQTYTCTYTYNRATFLTAIWPEL